MHSVPNIVLISFSVGLLIGVTGVGGGALMTPLLVLVFGLAPPAAISTDLVYACITKIFGSIAYWRSAHADIRLACTLASASLPGSALGTWTMLHLSHGPGSDHKVRITIGL